MTGLGPFFWGFLVLWAVLVVYLVRLDAKAKALRRQLDDLRRQIAEASRRGDA